MPDIDWGQVIFLILFVVVGFFRWLGNLIQQQKEAKERPTILTPQERALREAAWRKQTGQEAAPVPLPSPTSTAPPPDPFAEIKDLFKQIKIDCIWMIYSLKRVLLVLKMLLKKSLIRYQS
jgi:hypothetical protein